MAGTQIYNRVLARSEAGLPASGSILRSEPANAEIFDSLKEAEIVAAR
jgi:hypothetical protein